MKSRRNQDPAFEDSLNDDWSHDLDVVEVPIGNRPLFYLGIAIFCIVTLVLGQIIYLNVTGGAYYKARAEDNIARYEKTSAPRGIIYDREGNVLAESKAVFAAVLDTREFIHNESTRGETVRAAESVLGILPVDLASRINDASAQDFATPIVLVENLTQPQLVNLKALALPTIDIQSDFTRNYPQGAISSPLMGYTGRPNKNDLKAAME